MNHHARSGVPHGLRHVGAVATILMLSAAAGAAHAGEECLSKEVLASMSACPSGPRRASITQAPRHAYSSAVEKREAPKRDLSRPTAPPDATGKPERIERQKRMQKATQQLLVTEIANVERLLRATTRKSPDRPTLMRRLADNFVELESVAFRDKIEADVRAQALKAKDPQQARAALELAHKADAVLGLARRNAIDYYGRLAEQYPSWCQFPQQKPGYQGCADEVLYYLAYEHEQAKELDQARDVYLELVDHWKSSRFVPHAFLAFGELFFAEAQGDPSKWSLAEQAYGNVVKAPPPDNKLYGYARYKLAYVYWNEGKLSEAVAELKRVIEFGTSYPALPGATGLADSARRDIIPVYAQTGSAAKAYDFFKPLSGDGGNGNDKTFKMMEALGTTLLDTGHYDEAIVLYRDLIKRNPGEGWCQYQAAITQSVMAAQSGNKPAIVGALEEQLAAYRKYAKEPHASTPELACANETAGLLTETAMAWHLEAVGSGGVRGTSDPRTMAAADGLYKLVLANFTAEQFRQFRFPRIVKEDWPSVPKIRYAMADLLFFQGKWAECGPAFDAAVAEDPTGPDAAEAAFAEAVCYERLYAARHKDGSDRRGGGHLASAAHPVSGGSSGNERDAASAAQRLAPKELSAEQKGMLGAFDRYLCAIEPPKGNREALEQYVEIEFARARTYFEAQHWPEAAAGFREIALSHAELDAGIYAAQLYLEALNVMATKLAPARGACLDDMGRDVTRFAELYCGDRKQAGANADQCATLERVARDVERKAIDDAIRVADAQAAAGKPDLKAYEQLGQRYLALWKKYGEQPCKEGKAECLGNDQVLYNTARVFQAAHLVAKAISVRRMLVDPHYHLDKTELGRKAVREIGGNYQAIAVYADAAEWYERFAKESPDMADAPTALSDAVVLRLGLGQVAEAMADAKAFTARYGSRRPAEAAQVAFAIGAHDVGRGDWRNAERRLSGALRQIEASATLEVQLQAEAMLGRTYARLGQGARAAELYGKVRDAWRDPVAGRERMRNVGGTEDEQLRRLGKALTAVGEARYFFAERRRAEVEAIQFPEYRGSGERKDVERHIATKVKQWKERKDAAIRQAEHEYLGSLDLEPAPPEWVIAAGAAVGKMWGRYVAEFRAAPYPKEWDQPGASPYGDPNDPSAPPLLWSEIRAEYLRKLDEASEKQKQQAKAAYEKCLSYSVKYMYFDQDSRSCESWLSKSYPGEYHLIDELRDAAARTGSGLDERAQPLDAQGAPLVVDRRQEQVEVERKAAGSRTRRL